jgi:hypothetical protein
MSLAWSVNERRLAMNIGKRSTIVAAACFAGLIIACGSGDDQAEPPFSPGSETAAASPASPKTAVNLTAKKTEFKPSVLHNGGDFTSVEVTVTNNSDENVSVNPLSFTITAVDGEKHNTELVEDDRQIETLTLASGEHVTGVITAAGKFQPARVTFNVNYGEAVVADLK